MRFSTKTIHAGQSPEKGSGAVVVPIFQTSTFKQDEINGDRGFEYSRSGNPTRKALEDSLAALFSGMISFKLTKADKSIANSFFKRLNIISLAESLGGVESLICYPPSMTHASMPEDKRIKIGVTENLIRLSVGIEDANDLIEDLSTGLDF